MDLVFNTILPSAAMIAAAVGFVWFFVRVIQVARQDERARADYYARHPCCQPDPDDEGPSYAAIDTWAGRYPGGSHDPFPAPPPTDYPGRIGA